MSSMRSIYDVFAAPAAGFGKRLPNRKHGYHGMISRLTSLRQANVGSMQKYSLHLIFTFYLDRDTSVLELFPVVVFQQ